MKGGEGVFPTMTSRLFLRLGSAVQTQHLSTILPRNQIPLGPCEEGNAERPGDELWEEQLWEEHCGGSQTAEAPAAWGLVYFTSKLGRCSPALECPHYTGKMMDIHPTTAPRPRSGTGKGA